MISIYIITIAISLLYAILIGSFTFGWFSLKVKAETDNIQHQNVTILIPFRNEEKNLKNLLHSLSDIRYPGHLIEFVFIDDGSEDAGCELIESLVHSFPFKLRLINSSVRGKKAAITFGISQSKGDIIVCTDADCIVQKSWISEIVQKFNDKNLQMVLGPVAISGKDSLWNSFQKIEFMSLILCSAGAVSLQKPIMANGANIAYRRKAFAEVEGFSGNEHIDSGDDVFLMMKVLKQFGNSSVTFIKSNQATVFTGPQKTLSDFLKQRIRWASKSPSYGSLFSKVTALSVLLMNILLVISLLITPLGKLFSVLFLLIWLFKILVDLPVLVSGSAFFKNSNSLMLLPVIEIITAVLTVIPGILSFFIIPEWKSRRIRVK